MKQTRFFRRSPPWPRAFRLPQLRRQAAADPDAADRRRPRPAASRTAPAGRGDHRRSADVPQELRTPRVPVRTGATQVAYLKDAQWVEMPSPVRAAALGDDRRQDRPGRARSQAIHLRSGHQADRNAAELRPRADRMEAVLVYDAALARGADAVETRRFEARVPVAAIDAANGAAGAQPGRQPGRREVAAWVGG
jgi:cholesterol transport system auxiliary component